MSNNNSVFLAWRSPNVKKWFVVGLLSRSNEDESSSFTFNYTNGALSSGEFVPFSGMDDLYKTYKSKDLFPLFKNRLLSKKRSEYPVFIKWLGLEEESSAIDVLGRSGGTRETDQLQMFQRVKFKDDGSFKHVFFSHGLSHLAKEAKERVSRLQKGNLLYFSLDCQNLYDVNAIIIRAENPAQIVGYCPRYLASDISSFLRDKSNSVKVLVESISNDSPSHYRLMCKIEGSANREQIREFMNKKEFQIIGPKIEELLVN